MFASRACRTSVMVGTALSKADMRRLVSFDCFFLIAWTFYDILTFVSIIPRSLTWVK